MSYVLLEHSTTTALIIVRFTETWLLNQHQGKIYFHMRCKELHVYLILTVRHGKNLFPHEMQGIALNISVWQFFMGKISFHTMQGIAWISNSFWILMYWPVYQTLCYWAHLFYFIIYILFPFTDVVYYLSKIYFYLQPKFWMALMQILILSSWNRSRFKSPSVFLGQGSEEKMTVYWHKSLFCIMISIMRYLKYF